ncbi:mandelate racemase/muconate lactonizing enzyme family protein [Blastococcus sp. VKM Ac-2987]|uniref:mandelate racemase/muconate lactonizing enzyme family protein n=1 Tax=Blastococcus sp. VKM Ac-2987 TaxID=3004141 RepID=UPI0022AB5405|nr:mandelate racemase/muconate lactonizing enzyme family protein [Blastococcus sp. VKM Ac-2987]
MRIVDIREQTVPIQADMSNAFINFSKMTVSVLALVTDEVRDGEPVVGYGFNSNGRYAQGGLLRERIMPRVLEAEPGSLVGEHGDLDPELIWRAAMRDEKPGGHGDRAVAMGVLDMAAWDLAAKLAGLPLNRLLSERARDPRTPAPPAERVWVYAAGGYYYPGRGLEALQAEMLSYVDLGYRTVKMKIGGAPLADDLRRIEAVLDVLPDGCDLAVDANGRFDLDRALAYADALSAYPLHWYEEAGDPLDFEDLGRLAERYPGPLATGENLMSFQDARNLIRYGGLRPDRDVLQMDPALSYGLTEFRRIVAMLFDSGWNPDRCVPHGGHQFNLSIASAFHLRGCESYPGVFEPFGGFADGYPVEDGHVRLPDAPGIGLEQKASLAPVLRDVRG